MGWDAGCDNIRKNLKKQLSILIKRYQKILSKRHAQKIHDHVTFTNPHSNSKCNLLFSRHWLLEKAVQINFTPPFSVHSTPLPPILLSYLTSLQPYFYTVPAYFLTSLSGHLQLTELFNL